MSAKTTDVVWEAMNMQKAIKKKAPVCESTVSKEAWLLFDANSTVRTKKNAADKIDERIQNRLEAAKTRYDSSKDKLASENDAALQAKAKLEFLTELYDFVQIQANTFISINNTINDQKKQMRNAFENKIKTPAWVKFFEKAMPWLFAGGAGATVGFTIWSAATNWLESRFPNAMPGLVKDGANFVGLAIVGVSGYFLAKVPGWRQSRLEKKYNENIKAVNEKEGSIRTNMNDLVQIEYRRLAKEYGFQVPKPNKEDCQNAMLIVERVKNEYGFTLPYPPFDGLIK